MKRRLLAFAVVLSIAGFCFVVADEKPKAAKKEAGTAAPSKVQAAKSPAAPTTPAPSKRSPDEEAVLATGAALVKAFNQHDAKAFASTFTVDGEYVDEKGGVYHGGQALETEFVSFFEANPETSIEVQFLSTRSIAPGIIAADGATRFVRAEAERPVAGHCSLICTKEGGKWRIASLREVEAASEHVSNHEHVRQLEFMVGDWINEGTGSHVHFNCRWDEGGNFLVRDFAVVFAGQKTMSGTQRIGYDPLTGHLRAWTFDSAGGYADGYLHQDGESWVLQTSGVTAEGHMASGTQVFASGDKHRMTWQALDYVIGGDRVADGPKVTIVRKPPAPTTTAK
jgi:uncharacterized protein (TIGR02246 family)